MGLFSAQMTDEHSSVTARRNELNGGNCDNRLLKSRRLRRGGGANRVGRLGNKSLVKPKPSCGSPALNFAKLSETL